MNGILRIVSRAGLGPKLPACGHCGNESSINALDVAPAFLCNDCAHKAADILRELVECRDIERRAADMALSGKARAADLQRMYKDVGRRKPIAWDEARALFLGPNV